MLALLFCLNSLSLNFPFQKPGRVGRAFYFSLFNIATMVVLRTFIFLILSMKISNNSSKGFTLIELLIVIAIIAVLAVAFLPTILNSPAKARDTQRIESLKKIQKVLVNRDLEGRGFPTSACIASGFFNASDMATLGGTFPVDPKGIPYSWPNTLNAVHGCAQYNPGGQGHFLYRLNPTSSYKFGLFAMTETCSAANTLCSTATAATPTITAPTCSGATPTAATDLCFAIFN